MAKDKTESQFARFLQPVLDAVRALGGSARPREVKEWILANCQVPKELLESLNKTGETKFSNQVDWARFYLVRSHHLDASKRGVWSLTEKGRGASIDPTAALQLIREVAGRDTGPTPDSEVDAPEQVGQGVRDREPYKHRVLARIAALSPTGFEQLSQRILREAGFDRVELTGKSGDRGVDGHGIVQLNALVSERVVFQCKRYKHPVGPDVVRDFRGAMAGRANKGLILTTSSFTSEAEREAARDGVAPIELIDGDRLVELLEELEIGLKPIQTFEVDDSFFVQFDG